MSHPVGMLARRLQLHQIDNIDHSHSNSGIWLRMMDHRQRFECGHIAAAGHDYIALAILIGARPMPDAEARGAVA